MKAVPMTEPFETHQRHECTIHIFQDDCAENPRDALDTTVRLVCWHSRYRLGDQHGFDAPAGFQAWWAEAEEGGLCVPLYPDHSGLALATRPFHCPWDSGQVGWAYMTADTIADELSHVPIPARLAAARSLIDAEVELYHAYLSGDVWGYVIERADGTNVDSSWGYYGLKAVREAADDSARHHTDPSPIPVVAGVQASNGDIRHG